MTNWYIKEFSKLAGVTVRTLHHYDQIGLLRASNRRANGYRLYSPEDLQKHQQITALKSFGFELAQIKHILAEKMELIDHLKQQSEFLDEKISSLQEARFTLKKIMKECGAGRSIDSQKVVKLIEVFNMTETLEKSWAGKALTPEELRLYAEFREGLKTRFSKEDKDKFDQEWKGLKEKIEVIINDDPTSPEAIELALSCHKLIDWLYGKEFAGLRHSIWEKGFKGDGGAAVDRGMSPEMVIWLDKAMEAYWRQRFAGIFSKIATQSKSEVLQEWNEALEEMFGHDKTLKANFHQMVLDDKDSSEEVKIWVRSLL